MRQGLVEGAVYTGTRAVPEAGGVYLYEVGGYRFFDRRFVLADPLPDMTPDLLAALRVFHADRVGFPRLGWSRPTADLLSAIETTPGILEAPPKPLPLPAMWLGAEAFDEAA